MPVTYSRSYWKQKVAPDVLEKVRQTARQLDPSGALLRETPDLVRVIGSPEQIQAIERVAGLPDPAYWGDKAPAGSAPLPPKPPAPAAAAASAPAPAPAVPAPASAPSPAPKS